MFSIVNLYLRDPFLGYDWSFTLSKKRCLRFVSKLIHSGDVLNIPRALSLAHEYDELNRFGEHMVKYDLEQIVYTIVRECCHEIDDRIVMFWI